MCIRDRIRNGLLIASGLQIVEGIGLVPFLLGTPVDGIALDITDYIFEAFSLLPGMLHNKIPSQNLPDNLLYSDYADTIGFQISLPVSYTHLDLLHIFDSSSSRPSALYYVFP